MSNSARIWQDILKGLPAALKAAFDWRGLLTLFLAIFGTISLIARTFGIPLNISAGPVLDVYDWLRDGIFAPVSLLATYVGFLFPRWLKDALLVYFRVYGSVWRTIASITRNDPSRGWFSGLRWPIVWAGLAWPYHFLGFWRGWFDPVHTYRNVHPIMEVYKAADGPWATMAFYRLAGAHFLANILAVLVPAILFFIVNAYLRATP